MSRMDLLRTEREYTWDQEGWFVPLAAALEGVTAAQAAWQPPGAGNSIWQTVNHLNYYNERLLAQLTGTPEPARVADNDATFATAAADDNAAWQATLERTQRIAVGLRDALAAFTDADLDRKVGLYPLADQLPAEILHDAYHTGQIVLLRKQQGSWPAHRG